MNKFAITLEEHVSYFLKLYPVA